VSNSEGTPIVVDGNNATVSDVVLTNNAGDTAGGITINGNNATVSDVVLANNTGVDGGAIAVNGNGVNITNAKLVNNSASKSGGAIYVNGEDTVVANSELLNNTAADGTDNVALGLNAKGSVLDNVTADKGHAITYVTELIVSSTAFVYKGDAPIVIKVKTNAKDGTISVKVNGKTYTATVKNGVATISMSNLPVGTYKDIVVGYHDSTGLYGDSNKTITFTVKVNKAKIVSKSIKKDYNSKYKYKIRIIGPDGKPVKKLRIKVTIKGKSKYYRTDSKGYITIKLGKTYTPGKYVIKLSYKHVTSKRVITIKQILKTKKYYKFKKSVNKKLVLKAKLRSSKGKPLKGKKIYFKIKGKTFKAKTNKKGIAKLTIKKKWFIKKLKAGRTYKVKITYLKDTIKTKVKVKR
jgi:predicted outer membrane repeat protein